MRCMSFEGTSNDQKRAFVRQFASPRASQNLATSTGEGELHNLGKLEWECFCSTRCSVLAPALDLFSNFQDLSQASAFIYGRHPSIYITNTQTLLLQHRKCSGQSRDTTPLFPLSRFDPSFERTPKRFATPNCKNGRDLI